MIQAIIFYSDCNHADGRADLRHVMTAPNFFKVHQQHVFGKGNLSDVLGKESLQEIQLSFANILVTIAGILNSNIFLAHNFRVIRQDCFHYGQGFVLCKIFCKPTTSNKTILVFLHPNPKE